MKKKEFQDGRHDSHLGFPIQTIYSILDLQVTRMLPTNFRVKWPFSFSVQEKKRKIHFKDGCHSGHLGCLIGMNLSIFDLQVTLMLPTFFKANKPFGSGEEVKNRFSKWQPWQPF